jgi:[ribosomal protein S5]-alanine N-acetyltransferase
MLLENLSLHGRSRGDRFALVGGVIPSRPLSSAYQEHQDGDVVAAVPLGELSDDAKEGWRDGLPALAGALVTLRELRTIDARALFIALTTDDVTRFIAPPPPTVEGFEKFIAWSHRQRVAGQGACFAVVPRGSDAAIGLFQIRSLQPEFVTAEWGFALAPELWGSGFFLDAAKTAIAFAFDTLGTQRLEARATLANERGNAALRKLGASREAILRKSFLRRGEHHDQALWTILADEWQNARQWAGTPPGIH